MASVPAPAPAPGSDSDRPGSAGPPDYRGWQLFALLFFPAHALLAALTIGLRWEHVLLQVSFLALSLSGPRGRLFAICGFPMVLAAFQYDFVRYLVPFALPVHVADVHGAELALFGLPGPAGPLTPPEWFDLHTHPALDLLAGALYATYIPWAIGFCVALWWIDRRRMLRFALAYWLVNTLGNLTWFVLPVAPPWYVMAHGLGPAMLDAAASPAGALRFDQLLGITFFQSFYSRSAWVFGAMPSLHVGDPTVVAAGSAGLGRRWLAVALLYLGLMCFAAVYLQHHYLLDVLAGLAYGVLAWLAAGWLVATIPWLRRHAGALKEARWPTSP